MIKAIMMQKLIKQKSDFFEHKDQIIMIKKANDQTKMIKNKDQSNNDAK